MANYCDECGYAVEENWKNCPKCGTLLQSISSQTTRPTLTQNRMNLGVKANCVNCGKEISEIQYNNFRGMCPSCVRLEPIKKAAEFEKKSGKATWLCALIVIPLIIIITVIFGTISRG